MRESDLNKQVEDISDIKDILLKISEDLDKLLELLDKPEPNASI